MANVDIDLGKYSLGWSDPEKNVFKPEKGLSEEIIRKMSEIKEEPEWMLDFRLKAYKRFLVKPTKLSKLFDTGAFVMGVSTALMGSKAAYVCTEAVEEIIEEHYQQQIDQLEGIDEDVRKKIIKFQEDEVNHKNTAIDMGSKDAIGYKVLRKVINDTTKAAIFFAERY